MAFIKFYATDQVAAAVARWKCDFVCAEQ